MKKKILFINIRTDRVERLVPFWVANRMGVTPVLLTAAEPNIPDGLVTDTIIHNTYDIPSTLVVLEEYYRRQPFHGVVTWIDQDVELVAAIGEKFSLPALSPRAAKRVRSKFEMRKALSQGSDLCPRFHSISSLNDLRIATESLGTPLIFKPVGASGSKSILKIDTPDEIEQRWEEMLQNTVPAAGTIYSYYPNQYIVEEYLDGPEVCVDGLVQDNKIQIAGVTDKDVTPDYSIEYTAFFPSGKSETTLKAIKRVTSESISLLGLNNSAFHLEARVTSTGVKVLEVAGRPAGGYIASHLIEVATGVSFVEQVIKMALGEPANLDAIDAQADCYAGQVLVLPERAGIIKGIKGISDALETEGVLSVIPRFEVGDVVHLPPENFGIHLCALIGRAVRYDDLVNNLHAAVRKMDYQIS